MRDSREDMLCEQTLMMKFHLYPPQRGCRQGDGEQ